MPHIVRVKVPEVKGGVIVQSMLLALPPIPRDDFVRKAIEDAQIKIDRYCEKLGLNGYALDSSPDKWVLRRVSENWAGQYPVEVINTNPLIDPIETTDGTWFISPIEPVVVKR